MFLRKLVVILLPLVMVSVLCFVLPALGGIPFWTEVLQGLLLGVMLSLLLPLCGAVKRREPFAGLLWLPLSVLVLTVLTQYLLVIGIELPGLDFLRTGDGQVVLVESLFIGFIGVQLIRTRK